MSETRSSFWSSLPGMITALATLVGSLAALLTALYTMGYIGPKSHLRANKKLNEQAKNQNEAKNNEKREPKELDRNNPKATAKAILKAYKMRDLVHLADLSTQKNRQILSALAQKGSAHPRYKSIFSGWRMEAIESWKRRVQEVRYRKTNNALKALVKFGENDANEEIFVVEMKLEEGRWNFDEISSPKESKFESLSKTP